MILKKYVSILLSLCLIIELMPIASATSIQTDMSVKLSTAGDETYTTNLSNISHQNTDLTFQFAELSSGGYEEYSLSFPTGFDYLSGNTLGTSCAGFSTINASDGNYHFSFSGTTNPCLAKTEFSYRITPSASAGAKTISLLRKNGSSWDNAGSVIIDVIANNMITQAQSLDTNDTGYIDAYLLSFATGWVTATTLSGITVAGVSRLGATASGSNWLIHFTDNVLDTESLPQIGGIFDSITLTSIGVDETDGAKPQILRINGTTLSSLGSGQSAHIGAGAFDIDFSERINPSFTGSFSLQSGSTPVPGIYTFNANRDILTFAPTTAIPAGAYTLASTGSVTDWTLNANTFSYTLLTSDCTASSQTINGHVYAVSAINNGASGPFTSVVSIAGGSVTYTQSFACSLGTISTSGGETASAPTCSAGYQVSGASCVAIPSTGGGGGSTPPPNRDTCPSGDTSWSLYDGKCSTPIVTSTGTTATGTILEPVAPWIPEASPTQNLSIDTLSERYFWGLSSARSYLGTKISDPRVLKLAASYAQKLSIPEESYFLSVDQDLFGQYNRVMNAYTILFLRVNDAVLGNRSASVKSDGRTSYGIVSSSVTLARGLLGRYITQGYLWDKAITVYRTNIVTIQKPLLALETKILNKLSLLRDNDNISAEEYISAVKAYNDFVLGLTMYRMYDKNPLAKEKALKAIKIFSATYAKEVVLKSQIVPAQAPSSTIQKIGDIYAFPRDLIYYETSNDVRNLQAILKSYGYFGTLNPTGTFGSLTKSYLIQFSKEILNISNPNGLFDQKIRTAIVKLDAK